ncbi:peptidylprolyl isomerase [Phycisphaerales bacterium AB-hyl4]|uniref:Peptidyl-prolyl cis-trans isomerase n=1 Tax=Natronomicrosphaera hydrolytica TaxID=3242702 RepID=A0ABV4U341_9BACT
MAQVKQGDTVKVHYTGKLDDGTVFDTSVEREPIEFTLGEGQIIPGFEEAVEGLEPGQKTTTTIPAEKAYGQRNEEAVVQVERSQLPENLDPEVGQQLQMQQPNGQPIPVRVTDVSEQNITIDANHPLAGKDLSFEIELVAVA